MLKKFATRSQRALVPFVATLLLAAPMAIGQEEGELLPDFGLWLGIGTELFPGDGDDLDMDGFPDGISFQKLAITPEFYIGKFGIGLDIVLHYRFTGGDGNDFEIRPEDWDPALAGVSFIELYLPKIQFISWGQRGEPLFIKLGLIDDTTLGNGFIVGNYDNTLFLPETRIFGLNLNVDGQLFNFPFIGLETFVGNLAAFDVIGARLFARPLIGTDIPVLKNIQAGFTFATDTDIDKHSPSVVEDDTVSAFGVDIVQPIVNTDAATLVAFADYAALAPSDTMVEPVSGSAIGFRGMLFNFLTYGAQLRILGPNFVPTYFGPVYDLTRQPSYEALTAGGGVDYAGWFASIGTSLLENRIIFNVGLDGPFGTPATPDSFLNYPHLRAIFVLAEGLIPGISFDASYDKKSLGDDADGSGIVEEDERFFADLFSADGAVVQARFNYQTGPAVISFTYNILFDPDGGEPEITSGLESSIDLF